MNFVPGIKLNLYEVGRKKVVEIVIVYFILDQSSTVQPFDATLLLMEGL